MFTVLGIHCYCLQYKEYIVIVYSIRNTLLCLQCGNILLLFTV